MSSPDMIRDGEPHKGGNGTLRTDENGNPYIHYTNYTEDSRTSWDEDFYGNISRNHSTDSYTREHTQHGSDSSVTGYSK